MICRSGVDICVCSFNKLSSKAVACSLSPLKTKGLRQGFMTMAVLCSHLGSVQNMLSLALDTGVSIP